MTNAEKIAKWIISEKPKNLLIHTIPKTPFWLICQKNLRNLWEIKLLHPMKTIEYQLGTISDEEHLKIWHQLLNKEFQYQKELIDNAKNYKQHRRTTR